MSALSPSAPAEACASSASAGGARRSRRGRPTAQRVAEIDADILSAAREIFLQAGYEAATMEAVTERADISKGTLYARYDGKASLFRAVVQDRLKYWSTVAGVEDYLLPADMPGRLHHHARTLRRMMEWPEYRDITRLIDVARHSFPETAIFWQEAATRKYILFLARDMAAASDEHPGTQTDWFYLAELFLHGFTGWYRTQGAARAVGEEEIQQFTEKLIGTILIAANHQGQQI